MNVENGVVIELWKEKFQIVSRSTSRCVLRASGARRFVATRLREPDGFVVRIFSARYDGKTVLEDFQPVVRVSGTFEEAFAELAEKI